jgi:predicted RNA binding protein YcfA (HicA-like mRNA interferase family)
MPKLPVIKAIKLLKTLKRLGFYKHHTVGSHIQLKHEDGRRITVPFHKGKDIRKGTLKSIINDLDMTVEDFIQAMKK